MHCQAWYQRKGLCGFGAIHPLAFRYVQIGPGEACTGVMAGYNRPRAAPAGMRSSRESSIQSLMTLLARSSQNCIFWWFTIATLRNGLIHQQIEQMTPFMPLIWQRNYDTSLGLHWLVYWELLVEGRFLGTEWINGLPRRTTIPTRQREKDNNGTLCVV